MSATARSVAAVALALVATGAPTTPAHARSPSTTTIALSTTTSVHGQTVSATAAVATVPGPAEGDVVFTVDATSIKANLGASGTATVVLPRSSVGTHQVTATFVPQFPLQQQGSTSPAQAWVVAQAPTLLDVVVTGRGARIPTRVRVHADGDFGTVPSGSVSVVVRRVGGGRKAAADVPLTSTGAGVARLGRLRAGSYRVVVAYAGDAQHLPARQVQRFRVRQR